MAGKERHIDESDAAFQERLREVRQQKTRIEEEYQDASERWRKERRRLNDEIDRLDQALQKAKGDVRKARTTDDSGQTRLQAQIDEAQALKTQAEEALAEERADWDGRKQSLEDKIAKLEGRLVEALERSSNPVRTREARSAAEEIEFEDRLRGVRAEAAEKLTAALAEWESEKGKLHLEIDRLKKAAAKKPAVPAPAAASPGPAETRPSRGWLADKLRARFDPGAQVHGDTPDSAAIEARLAEAGSGLAAARAGWDSERQELQARVHRLTADLDAARSAAPDPGLADRLARAETRVREVEGELEGSLGRIESSETERAAERSTLESTVRELQAALDEARRSTTDAAGTSGSEKAWAQERKALEKRLAAAEASLGKAMAEAEAARASELEWTAERESLERRLLAMEESLRTAEARIETAGTAAEEWAAERDGLRRQLDAVELSSAEWAAERDGLLRQIERAETGLRDAQVQAGADREKAEQGWVAERAEMAEKIEAGEKSLVESGRAAAAAEKEWAAERRALEKQLASAEKIVAKTEAAEVRGSEKVDHLQGELAAARDALKQAEKDRKAEEKERAGQIRGLAVQLEAASRRVDELQAAVAAAEEQAEQAGAARAAIETSLERAAAEHETRKQDLEQRVAELEKATRDGASRIDRSELDAVRDELLSKLGEAAEQRDALVRERERAAAAWQAERADLARAVDDARRRQLIDAERIEAELREKVALEFEFRIKDLEYQKERLESDLRDASTAGPGADQATPDALEAEMARVDEQIAEIVRFIDDPGSALSIVIRKNVERSELEAYRRGLAYRMEGIRRAN